jgi:hypothetical protein
MAMQADAAVKVRSTQRGAKALIRRMEAATNQAIAIVGRQPELGSRERAALLLTQAIGVSLHSLSILLDKSFMGARDAFGISRSICEGAVNACYLMMSDDAVLEKATRHAMQKMHREANKDVKLGGVRLNVSAGLNVPVSDMPGLSEALREFTRNNGSEIRDWSDKSIDQRIEYVASRLPECGTSLAASRLLIYGVSSEIIHGSLYGVIYFWTGLSGLDRLKETGRYQMMVHYLTAIVAAAFALDALVTLWGTQRGVTGVVWDRSNLLKAFERLVHVDRIEEGGTVAKAEIL